MGQEQEYDYFALKSSKLRERLREQLAKDVEEEFQRHHQITVIPFGESAFKITPTHDDRKRMHYQTTMAQPQSQHKIVIVGSGKIAHLDGMRFGSLTVIRKVTRPVPGGCYWHCECDCGGTIEVKTVKLTSGERRWCNECSAQRRGRHGKA